MLSTMAFLWSVCLLCTSRVIIRAVSMCIRRYAYNMVIGHARTHICAHTYDIWRLILNQDKVVVTKSCRKFTNKTWVYGRDNNGFDLRLDLCF